MILFVRGLIHLPIIGAAERFRWGVWGSLSRRNFETLRNMHADPKRIELPAMFSCLSSQILEYPDKAELENVRSRSGTGQRPHFRLELTDHPLSQDYHKGITLARVKEIMLRGVRESQ